MSKILSVMKKVHGETWIVITIAVLLLVLWEVSVRLEWSHSPFFPAPSAILRSGYDMIAAGELQENIGISLIRLLAGFCIGVFAGILVGLGMGWSRRLRLLLDPIISFIYPIPKIAILPLIMLIIGFGEHTLILIIALSAFFPVVINTIAGIVNISPTYFDIAKTYGANRLQIFTKVIFPGSLTTTMAGVRLALGLSLVMVIVAEMTMANEGIGAMLWLSWATLRIERIFVALLLITIISLLLTFLLKLVFSRLAPWSDENA